MNVFSRFIDWGAGPAPVSDTRLTLTTALGRLYGIERRGAGKWGLAYVAAEVAAFAFDWYPLTVVIAGAVAWFAISAEMETAFCREIIQKQHDELLASRARS